ncbi:MAG: transketolase [Flavobacteriales bacterium]|jgi:transketolase|uniref:transketolase n=1 Tax=Blattabacterium sp. (Mastotermes darwiniensis) TaxID=39768 RepID=UPI000231DFAC|nr:transketolase [Blattabacterium sp. (Mastotermes darwiniensis)]AER40452.1 Transketolase B [Blattabacterium sp. (Mastotermes darwiniensis) str. MADAR]MDR1805032.1 transketolase [Flavobacteriales bacterium]
MNVRVRYLKNLCTQVRRDILRMVNNANSGHPGGSLGCTEFFVALYQEIMHYDPKKFSMDGQYEDLFFLSNGHISPVYYSILARSGFFPIEELSTFRKLNSRLQGHPSVHGSLPGIRISSGSLGQGMSVAIGAALSKKLSGEDYSLIYSLHGDGELNEGQIWESVLYAGSKNIDNYIATVDYNGQQIDGTTDEVLPLGNMKKKFQSFDWKVLEELEGNNIEKVINILKKAKSETGKGQPVLIILYTKMGYGVDFMVGSNVWHGKSPNEEELKEALSQLTVPPKILGDYPIKK